VSAEQRGEATGGVNDALRSQEQVWRQILSHLLAEEVQGTQETEGGGLQRMSFLTLDIKEMREKWMKFYLNIMMLKSHNEKAKKILEEIKQPSAEYNSKIMQFFDDMEEKQ